MPIKKVFFVITLLISHSLFSQGLLSIDSLKTAYEQNPTDKEILIAISDYYKSRNLDSLNLFADKLVGLSESTKNRDLRLFADLRRLEGYTLHNQVEQAKSIFEQIEIDTDAAIENQITYQIIQGRLLKTDQKNNEALNSFYNAIKLIQEAGLGHLKAKTYVEIAELLVLNNDRDNSLKYYSYALNEAKKHGDVETQVKVCLLLCRAYNGALIVNLDSSVYYGELGMQIAKDANYEYGYATSLDMVTAPIIRQGHYRRGIEMSKEALKYHKKFNFTLKSQYYQTLNQGFAYEKLGLYDSAMAKMREGATLRPIGIDHFRLKYLIHKSRKEYSDALAAYETYAFKKDSIVKHRNNARLSQIQARLETNLKETEVANLTQTSELQSLQIAQQRYYLFGLVLVLIFLTIGALLLNRQRRLKDQQALTNLELEETKKRLEVEQQYRASELKALRSQMNPHFVFNALNSIQEYIMINEKKLAGKYLGKFADLMRIYLHQSQTRYITVEEEVEALNLYLELEKLRFEESLNYSISVDETVAPDILSIPSLLVQPYVENALKHGLLHKKEDRNLSISFHYQSEPDILECIIEDNGIGRERSMELNKLRNPNHQSFATSATKTRLELLNFTTEKPIGEHIEDLVDREGVPTGTKVTLSIPIVEPKPLEVQK